MEKCIIFCAAEFDLPAEAVTQGDFVIAADGGYRHTQALGIHPDAILGDFDSLGYAPAGAAVYPVEKDDTDAMLAVRLGLDRGFREFVVYGGLDGPRLDHTVANFQMLQFLADRGARGYLVGRSQMVTLIKDDAIRFPEGREGTLSVFCMGAEAAGVTIRGLRYELENGSLHPGFPLGCSNHFVGKDVEISVNNGSLLIIWDREGGFPQ